MTDDKKPRELTHESIQWVPKKAYDALAKENASLRASLKFAVETIEKALTYKNGICTTPTQNLEDNLAKIKAKHGEL